MFSGEPRPTSQHGRPSRASCADSCARSCAGVGQNSGQGRLGGAARVTSAGMLCSHLAGGAQGAGGRGDRRQGRKHGEHAGPHDDDCSLVAAARPTPAAAHASIGSPTRICPCDCHSAAVTCSGTTHPRALCFIATTPSNKSLSPSRSRQPGTGHVALSGRDASRSRSGGENMAGGSSPGAATIHSGRPSQRRAAPTRGSGMPASQSATASTCFIRNA